MLVTEILPPLALLRRGARPAGKSAEETWTLELIVTASVVEFRATEPPLPLGALASGWRPVVASIGESTVITPVVLTLKVPPLPAGGVISELSPPLKVTGPWMLPVGPKVNEGTLMVRFPPSNGPNPGGVSKSGPLKLIPPVDLSAPVLIVCGTLIVNSFGNENRVMPPAPT